MVESMQMKLGESEKAQWYKISLALGEDISQVLQTRKAKEKQIFGTSAYSYIMVLFYSEKNNASENVDL